MRSIRRHDQLIEYLEETRLFGPRGGARVTLVIGFNAMNVYLPQDELAAVGATDADIFAGRPTAAHREVVAKNAARARALLDDAEAGALAALPSWWASLMALVIVEQYRALLDVLADRDHDNLTGERCRVGKVGKMRAGLVAFGTLLKARARGVWFA